MQISVVCVHRVRNQARLVCESGKLPARSTNAPGHHHHYWCWRGGCGRLGPILAFFGKILAFFGNKRAVLQLFTGVTDGHSRHRWSQMVTGGHSWSQNRRGLGAPVDRTPRSRRLRHHVLTIGHSLIEDASRVGDARRWRSGGLRKRRTA